MKRQEQNTFKRGNTVIENRYCCDTNIVTIPHGIFNMLKMLVEKLDNMQDQMVNFSREMKLISTD